MAAPFRIEALSSRHDRSKFVSGSAQLDRYFREQATQDARRRIATCFVAMSEKTDEIAGFYTLTATAVSLDKLSPEIASKLPRYPAVPAVLLGRVALAHDLQGKGLGSALLIDALKRTSRAELGIFAMVVDAKDEAARRFYEKYGFTLLRGETLRLCLPMATALAIFGDDR